MEDPKAQPFAAMVKALEGHADVALRAGRGFGGGGLFGHGRLFAKPVGDRLLVRLPAERVAALVDEGRVARYETSAGRPAREWALVSCDADWVAVGREAADFATARKG